MKSKENLINRMSSLFESDPEEEEDEEEKSLWQKCFTVVKCTVPFKKIEKMMNASSN